jgi:tRNA-dihydrouridine synthase B
VSIQIGGVSISEPVVLAPMSGVTDRPFRRLVQEFGIGMTVTEMIASREALQQSRKSLERASRDPDARPYVIQLVGCEAGSMGEAARLCVDLGADIVDINMGCPARKVVGGEAGSALMRDEAGAGRIVAAVVAGAGRVPVTLKMRTGWDDASRNAPRLARLAESLGVAAVTVHGRTRAQRFAGRADWGFIRQVKAAVGIPVIANGDLTRVEDGPAMLQASGADAVMIGRAACGRPWFPAQVAAWLRGRTLPAPGLDMRRRALLEHYEAMLAHYGEARGLRIARKHLDWSLGAAGADPVRARRAKMADDAATVRRLVAEAFDRLGERQAA